MPEPIRQTPQGTLPYDAYLQIENIPGESTDAIHTGWIEIKQFSLVLNQKVSSSFSASGAPASGQADLGYFTIGKEIDKTSPKLALALCKGEAIKVVTLEICTQTGDKQPYWKIMLSNCIIAAIHLTADPVPASTEALAISKPVEWVSFAYGRIEWTYTELDHDTGKVKGSIAAHWDRKSNTGG